MTITVNKEKMVIELSKPRRGFPGGLSPTAITFLAHWLTGMRVPDIANAMRITRQNGCMQLFRIRNKLLCDSVQELAFLCYERGYVTIEDNKLLHSGD